MNTPDSSPHTIREWPATCALAILFCVAPVFALLTRGSQPVLALYFSLPVVAAEVLLVIAAAAGGFRPGAAWAALPRRTRLAALVWLVVAATAAFALAPERLKGVIHFLCTLAHAALALAVWDSVRSRWAERQRAMLTALAAGAAVYGALVFALVFAARHAPGFSWELIGAGVTNMRQLAFYGLTLSGIAIGLLASEPQPARRRLHGLLLMLGLFLTFWSGGRAGAGGAVAGIALVIALSPASERRRLLGWTLGAAACAAPLSEVLVPSHHFGFLRILDATSDFSADYSARRWDVWVDTLKSVGESPLFGHGEGQFRSGVAAARGRINHPHNALVQFLYQWGVIGTTALGVMVLPTLLAIRRAVAARPEVVLPACGAASGLIAMSMLEGSLFHVYPTMVVILCLAMIAAAVPDQLASRLRPDHHR